MISNFANATATFYTHDPDATAASPYDADDWAPLTEDVDVFWDSAGTEFENVETGDRQRRAARIYAPISIADDHDSGDRVDVTFRGRTKRLRLTRIADRVVESGGTGIGFVECSVAAFGD